MTVQEVSKIVDDYLKCTGKKCRECKASKAIEDDENELEIDYCYMLTVLKDKLRDKMQEKIKETFNEI